MRCFWCDNEDERLTDDHILPRSLGGTAEFLVQACGACQNRISKAELEVSRKSMLAIHALASTLPPRHPDRPTSGHLRPTYFLVKHPQGGYGETLLSAGEQASLLPYFEIKVVPGKPMEGRVRGTTEGARSLLETFRKGLQSTPRPDKFLFQITVSCDLVEAISADESFWPRIVLLPGDRLLLRGRSPDEIMRFVKVFMQIATSDYAVPVQWSSNQDGQILGGTPHLLSLKFDPQAVRRVAAKVAYGLFRIITGKSLEPEQDLYVRRYILGLADAIEEPVSIEPDPLNTTTSDRPHIIVLSPPHDPQGVIVSLYDYRFRVHLGLAGALPAPIAVLCAIDGSSMRLGSDEETQVTIQQTQGIRFSQPWQQVNGDENSEP